MNILMHTLSQREVSIVSERYGTRAYVNTTEGRAELAAECPPELVAKVLAMWGDTPAVDEPEPEDLPQAPSSPTLEQRTAALEGAMLAMMGGDGSV